jgi:putative chitinase
MDAQTLAAAVGCTPAVAQQLGPHISATLALYGINTPVRQAAFLAQVGHESNSFRWLSEIWGPTDAQKRYEGRADLGNTEPGDGYRYRGRGLIQTTGRANYRTLTQRLRGRGIECPDFEAEPDALVHPQWACISAGDYWDRTGCNALADAGDFEALTRRINGGLNGLADRIKRWERAKAVLTITTEQTAEPSAPQQPAAPVQEAPVLPAIIAALAPSIVSAIPQLAKVWGSSGSEVAQRNIKTVEIATEAIVQATQATNLQDAVEKITSDPAAAQAAQKAVSEVWFEITEAGSGGIAAARKADAEAAGHDGPWWQILRSPSFWALLLLLPLVYILVLSLVGLIGAASWSDDVRAGLAGSIISAIIGGSVGYYWGQTTSRNRAPSP